MTQHEKPPATHLKTQTKIFLIATALIGMYASAELLIAELTTLSNPQTSLGCDINPLIGCSSSLLSWQAHLIPPIPNSLIGTIAFAATAGALTAWLGTGKPPRQLMLTIELGLSAALGLIGFFLYQSVTFFRALCPFCLITWVCTIVLWIHLGAALTHLGWLKLPTKITNFWVSQRWLLTITILGLIVLVVTVTLSDKLMYLF